MFLFISSPQDWAVGLIVLLLMALVPVGFILFVIRMAKGPEKRSAERSRGYPYSRGR